MFEIKSYIKTPSSMMTYLLASYICNQYTKKYLILRMDLKTLITALIASITLFDPTQSINWNGNNWALHCDFPGNDLSSIKIRGEDCGGKCSGTQGCTHFAWTNWQGGTCWLKSGPVSQSDAKESQDSSSVCGVVQSTSDSGGGGELVGSPHSGVLTTRHAATEAGACQLPEGDYVPGIHPVALGNIESLGDLKHQPGLCGHILRVDCGHGKVDVIVSNANLGGGLDLYASTWDLATNNKPPGEEWCTVQLTSRNPFSGTGPRCYYSPQSEKDNDYYHLLGVFNTQERIVYEATLDGKRGDFNSITAYFAFNFGPVGQDAQVNFKFRDGSVYSMRLGECRKENGLHIWN